MQFTKDQIEDIYFLTPMQEGMLFHTISDKESSAYFNQLVLKIEGRLDTEILERSFNLLIARYDVFRTIIVHEKVSKPVQIVLKAIQMTIREEDLSHLSPDEQAAYMETFICEDKAQGFDLSRDILMRVALIKTGESSYQVIWSHHHLLMDGWCLGIVLKELFQIYGMIKNNQPVKLKTVFPYKNYIKWIEKQDTIKASEHWESYLAGCTQQATLPKIQSLEHKAEYNLQEVHFVIEEELTQSLKDTALEHQTTLNILIQVAWGILLQRYNDTEDVVYGSVISGRQADVQGIDQIVGLFINTVPVRISAQQGQTIAGLIEKTQDDVLASRSYDYYPLYEVQAKSELKQGLINHILLFENYPIGQALDNFGVEDDLEFVITEYKIIEQTNYDFNLVVIPGNAIELSLQFNSLIYDEETVRRIGKHFIQVLQQIARDPNMFLTDIEILSEEEKQNILFRFNETTYPHNGNQTIVSCFEEQADRQPDTVAYVCGDKTLTYRECNQRANQLAHLLRNKGVVSNQIVGLLTERSLDMVIGMLGILKAGGAYLPLDPTYPANRIAYMLEESGCQVLVSEAGVVGDAVFNQDIVFLECKQLGEEPLITNMEKVATGEDLAYVIYTSGSTGKPKGVMVTHANVINFFEGMNQSISPRAGDCLLAATSMSFDISVLELLWTAAQGIQVVIQTGSQSVVNYDQYLIPKKQFHMDFSLFFFSSYNHAESDNKYKQLIETTKFADEHGFKAVWTPERHFHEFGGLYSNPSITSAALAAVTKQIQIRSGSVVSPLHDSLRIAEEWSIVDNISNGRAGISFASGWHPNDFVLAPDIYDRRNEKMYEQIEEIKRLWEGKSVERKNSAGELIDVKTYPRPVQKTVPIWVTTSGSKETYIRAGKIGANLLTHMLGQDIGVLAKNIALYRKSLKEHGFEADSGKVTVMLHTFVGDDMEEVKAKIKEPFCQYLRSSFSLIKDLKNELGSDNTIDQIIEIGFERYWNTAALLGTHESCAEMVERLHRIGVNEIACLIDFGIDNKEVMQSLGKLNKLQQNYREQVQQPVELIVRERRPVTMMQTTPSRLKMLVEDKRSQLFLRELRTLLVGGEAFPPDLAKILREKTEARIFNMYGPTETTIWSTTHELTGQADVSIGRPICNTQVYILDSKQRPVPVGITGEIYIGGYGVTNGYHNQKELTTERFTWNLFDPTGQGRIYRTSDIGRYLPDGTIEVLGRKDNQIKIRGYRVELGEIESNLVNHPEVLHAVVLDHADPYNNLLLVGYVVWKNERLAIELKEYLQGYLPNYMIPSTFVTLTEIPLTTNGKIDRNALRNNYAGVITVSKFEPPRNELEEKLVRIWSKVLGREQINIRDNFFDIGGHSLLAVKLEVEMEKNGIHSMELAVFRYKTIVDLAEEIIKRRSVQEVILK